MNFYSSQQSRAEIKINKEQHAKKGNGVGASAQETVFFLGCAHEHVCFAHAPTDKFAILARLSSILSGPCRCRRWAQNSEMQNLKMLFSEHQLSSELASACLGGVN